MFVIAAAEAAAVSVSGGILASLVLILDTDCRSGPNSRTRKFSIRQSQFGIASPIAHQNGIPSRPNDQAFLGA